MQKITPFLGLDSIAEEAVAFYLSVFKDGKIIATTHYPENGPQPGGAGDDDRVLAAGVAVRGAQWRARLPV